MKQKFIEWFTKGNNGCAPSINADGSFEQEKTQHMFEAYQAGMAESDRKVEQLAAENAALKSADAWMKADQIGGEAADKAIEAGLTPDEATRAGIQAVIESIKTPSTDAILAKVRASGVEMFALMYAEEAIKSDSISIGWRARASKAASEYAAQLRQGVQS